MSFLLLGFFTGLSLILAIGAQNIFVIEQGLKKQYIFLVCLICAISDFILIFLGIFLFQYFSNFFNSVAELILNKNIPDSDIVIFKGSSHNVHLEIPNKFNVTVKNFLES